MSIYFAVYRNQDTEYSPFWFVVFYPYNPFMQFHDREYQTQPYTSSSRIRLTFIRSLVKRGKYMKLVGIVYPFPCVFYRQTNISRSPANFPTYPAGKLLLQSGN